MPLPFIWLGGLAVAAVATTVVAAIASDDDEWPSRSSNRDNDFERELEEKKALEKELASYIKHNAKALSERYKIKDINKLEQVLKSGAVNVTKSTFGVGLIHHVLKAIDSGEFNLMTEEERERVLEELFNNSSIAADLSIGEEVKEDELEYLYWAEEMIDEVDCE